MSPTRRHFTTISLLLVSISLLASVMYWWQLSASAARLRNEAIKQAEFRANQVTQATAEEISLLFHDIDVATNELAQAYAENTGASFDAEVRRVEARLPSGSILQVAVIDANGYLAFSNLGLKDRVYLGDREHFKVHLNAPNNPMFISKPVLGRVSKQWSIQFSRPVKRDDRFSGVVVLSVSPAYLQKALISLTLATDDSIAIFRESGEYLARNRDQENALGKEVGPNRPFVGVTTASRGSFKAIANYDQTLRIFEWQRLKDYPVTVVLGLSESAVLEPIESIIVTDRLYAAAGTILLWLFTAGGVLLLRKIDAQNQIVLAGSTQLRLLTENVYDYAIVMLDRQGYVTTWNEGARQLKGFDAADIVGKFFGCFYTPEDIAAGKPQQILAQALEEGSYKEEGWRLRKDGSQFYADVVVTALRDDAGEHLGFSKITRDITDRKLGQQKLERLLAEQRTLLENELVGIVTVRNRFIQWANPAFEALLGYPSGSLTGAPTRQCYPSDAAYLEFGAAAYPVLQARKVFRSQIEMIGKEGNLVWVDISGALIDGDHQESLWAFIDITDRKLLEAQLLDQQHQLEKLVEERTAAWVRTEARATHLLQSSADGLYGVDTNGKITFMNNSACLMLGLRADQVIGMSAHDLFHHHRPDGTIYPIEECPGHTAVVSGEESRIDNEVYWHTDGHSVPVMYAIHPMVQEGVNLGAVISFVDMSEQRAAATARERALVAAENLARVRSEFLSNMSHEIRTPINGVMGFAEIGYRNYQNSEKARNAFEKILKSGDRLLGVINEILDFSKIEAGKLGVEQIPVVLDDVIEQTVDVVRELVDAKHLDLHLERASDLPKTCVGDPLRIGQVLLNLLSNAVKFTETGRVSLVVSLADQNLIFQVSDTGIGMDSQQLVQLFSPFQQADGSTTRRFGGTGLGLAIAKRMAQLMDGDISVESVLGKGSTFEFHLPYRPCEGELTPTVSSSAGATEKRLKGMTILVAEDEPINQEILELSLTEEGARVVLVNDGRQAIERILQDGPAAYNLVLMDMQMPELDGLAATRQILEIDSGLPVIGQTANAFAEDQEKCIVAGMVGYIAKPINSEALVKLILQHRRV